MLQEQLDYLVNLMEASEKKDWNRAIGDLGLDIHPDSLRKAFGTSSFSGYEVFKFMRDKIENNFMSDEEFIRLETLRDKEYKERVRLQDANREKRKYLRDFSRLESIKEYIENLYVDFRLTDFQPCEYIFKNGNEACLLISDIHLGAVEDNIFNYYDKTIAEKRLNDLLSNVISLAKHDNVDLINVEILGDMVTGIINGSGIAQAEEDIFDQIFSVCEIIASFVLNLRENIPHVKIYNAYGNHGRLSKDKTAFSSRTNFERVIPVILRGLFKNTDIQVITNKDEDFIHWELRDGRHIISTHGTKDTPKGAVKAFTNMLGVKIFEVHMGHYHNYQVNNGTVVNGSLVGDGDYNISLRETAKPKQIMKVYRENITTTYEIELE